MSREKPMQSDKLWDPDPLQRLSMCGHASRTGETEKSMDPKGETQIMTQKDKDKDRWCFGKMDLPQILPCDKCTVIGECYRYTFREFLKMVKKK